MSGEDAKEKELFYLASLTLPYKELKYALLQAFGNLSGISWENFKEQYNWPTNSIPGNLYHRNKSRCTEEYWYRMFIESMIIMA